MANVFHASCCGYQVCGKICHSHNPILGTDALHCIAHELPELVCLGVCISPLRGPKPCLQERYGDSAKALGRKHISATGLTITWRYCNHQVTEAYKPLCHWRKNKIGRAHV